MEDFVLSLVLYAIVVVSITFGFTVLLSLYWMLPKDDLDGDHDPEDYGAGMFVTMEDSATKFAKLLVSFAISTPIAFGLSAVLNLSLPNDNFDGEVQGMLVLYAIIAIVISIAFACAALLSLCWMLPKADLGGDHDPDDYLAV